MRDSEIDYVMILKCAHEDYVDWWLPIDVAGDSFMAPMGFLRFLTYMLYLPQDEWWDRWVGNEYSREETLNLKHVTLDLVVRHYLGYVDVHEL